MTRIGSRWLGVLALLVMTAVPASAEWTKGTEAFRAKEWATAAKEFAEVTQTNPDYAGAYYMLGLSQSNQGKLSQALANLRKAVELDTANSAFKVALGQALLQAKQYSEAYSTLKGVSLDSLEAPHRSRFALIFAQAATKSNHASEAIQVLNNQTRADPRNPRLQQALGVAYDSIDDQVKAYAAFKRAYELGPKDQSSGRSAAYAAIAMARRARGEQEKARLYGEAAAIAEKLASSAPSFEHNLLAGEAWLGAQQFSKALPWFDKAQKQQSQNALVYFYRGQCYTSLNRFEQAISELQKALRMGPDSRIRTQIYNQLGYVCDKKKDYDCAISNYQEAGNSSMVAKMREKKGMAAQNLEAAKECSEFKRKIDALKVQISELEKLGESDEVKSLREQLPGLEATFRDRCR